MSTVTTRYNRNWLAAGIGSLLLVSFFLPWVSWAGTELSGYAMPAGTFFKVSAEKFQLGNPFPQFDWTLLVFWLIPVLCIIVIGLSLAGKRASLLAYMAGALSLGLITVFILFTRTLVTLGVGNNVPGMLKPWLLLHGIAAVALIFSIDGRKFLLKKLVWLVVGPVFAFTSFTFIQRYLEKQTFADTANVKADYTIGSRQLLDEFLSNDTLSNKKYLDKVLVVNGEASAVEVLPDSTSTIRFADSTGSYAIFSLEKDQLETVKTIKPGDPVSLKGVCSGSIYSEILGTTSISFKRTTLNKNKR
jgi:hypothetical protein